MKDHNYTIRIASGLDAPPLLFTDKKGNYSGLTVEYHKVIARSLKMEIVEVPVEKWIDGVNKMKDGTIDIITMQKTVKREESFAFTQPYIEFPYVLVTRKKSEYNILNLTEMAVVEGFLFADYIKQNFPDIKIVTMRNNLEALKKVSDGEVKACGISMAYATYLIDEHQFTNLAIADKTDFLNSLAFSVPQSERIFADIVDKVLNSISEKERRRMYTRWIKLDSGYKEINWSMIAFISTITLLTILLIINRKYLQKKIRQHYRACIGLFLFIVIISTAIFFIWNFNTNRIKLTEEELQWLKTHEINIPSCINAPPYGYRDNSGKYVGINVDIAHLMEERFNLKMNWICLETWQEVVSGFQRGELTTIVMEKTADREKLFSFTKPVFTIPYVLITRQNQQQKLSLTELSGRKVIVTADYLIGDYLKENYPEIRIETVPDDQTGLMRVSFGENDIFLGNLAYCSWIIENKGITNLKIAGETDFENKLSWATLKENEIFRNILQKFFNSISERNLNIIQNRWINIKQESYFDKKILNIMFLSISIITTFILLIIFWNYLLRRTVRRQTEQIRESEQKSRALLSVIPDLIFIFDRDGYFIEYEDKGRELYITEDFHGKLIDEILPENIAEITKEKVLVTLNTGKIQMFTYQLVHPDYGLQFYEARMIPYIENNVMAIVRNITEKVRLEEMVVQSEKMHSIEGLAAGMAHEINNPLAGMIQTAGVMAERLSNDKIPANLRAAEEAGISMEAIRTYMETRKILPMIEIINKSGRRVADIVENILSFSQKGNAVKSSSDPVDLLDRILELAATDYNLKKQLDFKEIKIVKEYAGNLPQLPCDSTKIQQVLLNILRNGAEAMSKYTMTDSCFILRLALEKESKMLRIEIEDNGPGMDKATRKRIFEPFFTTKPVGVGTGLGLSISYFIITENHGGTITVESQPGKGANFIIRLPLE